MLLVCAPAAHAWSWPVQGPVLQPFAYDESHPYAAGQHRGIDIGAGAAGEQVVAPADGTVSFAGSVPTNGECVTIQTPDGYTVTLTHLGTLLVAKGASVFEGQAVATVGPGGTPELDRPYVHLGIRTTADPDGYLDPLGLLPPPAPPSAPAQSAPAQGEPAATQEPGTSGSAASIPAQPTPRAAESSPPSVATTRGSTVTPGTSRVSQHEQTRAQNPPANTLPQRPSRRPATRHETRSNRVRLQRREAPVQTSTAQGPVVEATAPSRPAGLDAGRENRPSAPVARRRRIPHSVPSPLPLALNGAAALVALAAALAARRRRGPKAGAQVFHLPRPRSLQRAA